MGAAAKPIFVSRGHSRQTRLATLPTSRQKRTFVVRETVKGNADGGASARTRSQHLVPPFFFVCGRIATAFGSRPRSNAGNSRHSLCKAGWPTMATTILIEGPALLPNGRVVRGTHSRVYVSHTNVLVP